MKYCCLVALVCSVHLLSAQKKSVTPTPPKQPLSHTVYDAWNDITYKALTPDGLFAAFTVNPQDGDGKAAFCSLKLSQTDFIPRADNISLTYDSKYAVMKIKPEQKVVKDLRRQKKKKDELPKDSLAIYSFLSRKTEKIPDVKSYKIPEKAGEWVAYQLDVKKEVKPKTADNAKPEEKKPEEKTTPNKKAKKKKINSDDNGYTLLLKKLSDGKTISFPFVKEYVFAKFGEGLLFASTGNDSTFKAGIYWYDLNRQDVRSLYEGKSKYKYKGLSINEAGDQAAFLVDPDTTKALIRHFRLYHWKADNAQAEFLDMEHAGSLPQNWLVSENYTPLFSKDGLKLFFGSSPVPVVQDTTLLTEEIVNVEVWSGNDDYIYPQQNKQLEAETKRNYLVVYDLNSKTSFQLGSRGVPDIQIGSEGNAAVALGETNVPYRKMLTWDTYSSNDFYLFDLQKKERKEIASHIKGNADLSPQSGYVYWFSAADTAWFTYSVATGKTTKLNEDISIRYTDEENDTPSYGDPYDNAGWTAGDQQFLIYDRYDIWAFDPQNKKTPANLTRNGRETKTTYRYIKLDPEEKFIDPSKELLLSAFSEKTKESGLFSLSLTTGKLTKLLMSDHRYTSVIKATKSNQVLFTRENFREFPDLWASSLNFTSPKKISDANPQMKNYLWGSVELVHWTSLDNVPLAGKLYKPEGFDAHKKYPMMVYFYDRESDLIHRHYKPEPGRSSINPAVYVSNGYIVFIPDIVYKIGFPGESAHNCILPGITSLIDKGFIDEKNIGIQGHSWGGYQTAYLITRTYLFKAAEAGAPVVNMISAYGGIRWGTGLSRMFQYEHTQSRIGGTLWEKPMLFVDNSPIFSANKIQTPLLMLHNDNDDAVPWYQGIEMYMALRRLGKPVWLLNYNNELHGLVKRENRMDFQIRMMQFFDHFLKGAPEPEWMKKGIPAIEKGVTKGY